MDVTVAKKMSYYVNSVILVLVIALFAFFCFCRASFLIYFSIPTVVVYLVNYVLIAKGKLNFFVLLTYFWIMVYMSVATVCLGVRMGFYLYTMSMIPVIFVAEYMAYKLKRKRLGAIGISLLVAAVYLGCTWYSFRYGAIYEVSETTAEGFWVANSLTVIGFLIAYSGTLIKMVIHSEEKLRDMAHIDNLTRLYNRHYMLERFDVFEKKQEIEEKSLTDMQNWFVAMADVDDFKKINDTYGHDAGDYVLFHLAELMKEVCRECDIARWGGEEFLIFSLGNGLKKGQGKELMEQLRTKVEESPFLFEKKQIHVTITIGLSYRKKEYTMEQWIQDADKKLYQGKNSGKNKTVE